MQQQGKIKLKTQRFNVDQSAFTFSMNVKKIHEMVQKGNPDNPYHKLWVSQPQSGLDKRQVCFRPTDKQPRLAVIFRGGGERISGDEKQAWHPDVDVYFQENAWTDTEFCIKWVECMLSPVLDDPFVLFCDNLTKFLMQFKNLFQI